MPEFTVAKAADVPPGEARAVEAGGRTLALFNVGGKFYAIDNTCVHRGGPLAEGALEDTVVTCPWHGWQYDVTSGAIQHMPGRHVAAYRVRVEDGEVRVSVD